MKSAHNSTNQKQPTANQQALNVGAEQQSQKSLDDLLKDNGQFYNSLKGLVTNIKEFESNKYTDLSRLAHEFSINYSNYINQSPLAKDPKSVIFAGGLDAMLNGTDNTEQKKKYIQQVIDYLSAPLSLEYNKISKLLKPSDYGNMVKRAATDPMIMFNPFAQNMNQQLSNDDSFDAGLKFNQLTKDIKTDLEKDDYSKLGEYFERIPYNKQAFKEAGLTPEQTDKMMTSQNELFKKMVNGLRNENKKQLMGYMYRMALSEGARNLSKGNENTAMSALTSANPDPTSMLYLALNKGGYNSDPNGIAAGMNMPNDADMSNMAYSMGGQI